MRSQVPSVVSLLAAGALLASGCSVDRTGLGPAPDGSPGVDAGPDQPDGGDRDTGVELPDGSPPRPDAGPVDGGCEEGASSCAGQTQTYCSGGALLTRDCLGLGCSATDPTRCAQVVPSNGIDATPSATAADWDVTSSLTFDTASTGAGACTEITDGLCVRHVRNLQVAAGATLTIRGPNPLVVVASEGIVIDGIIDVGATGTTPGPGGFGGGAIAGQDGGGGALGGEAGLTSSDGRFGGGGGGALCGRAGNGGDGDRSNGGQGGDAVASTWLLDPLHGGGGGGAGRGDGSNFGAGGAGGGALQLTAMIGIELNGTIAAGGGGGREGLRVAHYNGSGGGGGAGGAVLLEGVNVTFGPSAAVLASGGGGGAGADNTTGTGPDGTPGDDGGANSGPAAGGSAIDEGGEGGDSGGGATLDGSTPGSANRNGGGGGGGAGCILIRTAGSAPPATESSPSVADGFRVMPVVTD